MNCRELRKEIDESEALGESGKIHLDACPECRKHHNGSARLAAMLRSLPRVEAPLDFDHRLRARIANGRPEQPLFFPSLRFIFPLAGVAVLMAIALTGFYFVSRESVESVAQVPTAGQAAPVQDDSRNSELAAAVNRSANAAADTAGTDRAESANRQPPEAANSERTGRTVAKTTPGTANSPEEDLGGSKDLASRDGKTINPPGIDSTREIATPEIVTTTNLNEVWELIGIKTVTENRRVTVRAVGENSVAERSGVRIGDEIEAIDGVKVTGDPLRGATIKIKSLSISRNGQKQEITLQQDR